MVLDNFMEEIKSIENPSDKNAFLSSLVDKRLLELEAVYREKAIKYTQSLMDDIESDNPIDLLKKMKNISKTQVKLIMIIDNLMKTINPGG